MKSFVILTRNATAAADAFARLAQAEAAAVWQGLADGRVRAVHSLAEGAGAALELETTSLQEARAYIEALPYVAEQLLDVQYCALKPFGGYAALGTPPD